MRDVSKIQSSSQFSSNKIWKQGSGSFTVPTLGGSGQVTASTTIFHGYPNDGLIFQVVSTTAVAGDGNWTVLPYQSGDGRIFMYVTIDGSNLTITRVNSDAGGSGFPATTVNFQYRLLIP